MGLFDKKKKVKNKPIPFKACLTVIKTERLPKGAYHDILCPLNKNIPHGH